MDDEDFLDALRYSMIHGTSYMKIDWDDICNDIIYTVSANDPYTITLPSGVTMTEQTENKPSIKEIYNLGLPFILESKSNGSLYEIHPHISSHNYGVVFPDGHAEVRDTMLISNFSLVNTQYRLIDWIDIHTVNNISKSQHKCMCGIVEIMQKGCQCGGI